MRVDGGSCWRGREWPHLVVDPVSLRRDLRRALDRRDRRRFGPLLHLAQGRQTLSEGLARVDQFSWTVPGMPVLTDQWLGQVAWYGAYAGLGWTGIILLRSLLVAGIATLIVAAALRAQPRPIVAVLAALPAITLTRFAWTEPPQLMGLFCFTLLLFLLRVAWERPRVLIAVPPLILLWANLHASFVP